MFEASADPKKRLLRVKFAQHVTADEARRGAEQLKNLVKELESGFCLLTDLSELDSMDPECAASIERTMDLCNKKGVARVVRVIPDPHKDIGLSIMSLFHYRRDVPIVTCETMEEANKLLTT